MEAEVGACDPQRPVYLLGESFGALLALAVAAARPDLVDRLVLANPATAFPRSPWARLGPLLPRVPPVPPRPPAPPRPRRASSTRRPSVRRRRARARRPRAPRAPPPAPRAERRCGAQALYPAVPLALAPALGNPILLAAFGVDASAPLAQQARRPAPAPPRNAEGRPAPAGAGPSGAAGARTPPHHAWAGRAGVCVWRGRGGAAAAAADAGPGAAAADARLEAAADRGRLPVRPRPACAAMPAPHAGPVQPFQRPHALQAPSAAAPSKSGRAGRRRRRRARAPRRGAGARAGRWRASCGACRRARWCWSPTATCSSPRARRARACRSCCRAACCGCRPRAGPQPFDARRAGLAGTCRRCKPAACTRGCPASRCRACR